MEAEGINFIRKTVPSRVEKLENGLKRVFYKHPTSGEEVFADYDTVLVAVGRHADLSNIGLDTVGATIAKSGKVITDSFCQIQGEKCENIYAIGDIVEGKLELTPTAILDGKLLAGRLLNVHNEKMNWKNIATTVFTPLE